MIRALLRFLDNLRDAIVGLSVASAGGKFFCFHNAWFRLSVTPALNL
jgi:hypothetical protein